ncbi:MAG: RNA polymerase sigma factor [Mycobacteriales bacterium]
MASANEKPLEPAARAFKQYYRQIYRFLLRRTRNPQDAEDLTQEVFVDAAAALEHFRPGETPVLALLYTIAHRRFVDATRKQARAQRISLSAADELLGEPATSADEREVALALREALQALPPEMRDVVRMKLIFGLSFSEISDRVGVSEVACRKRFQRALKVLRATLAGEGFGR